MNKTSLMDVMAIYVDSIEIFSITYLKNKQIFGEITKSFKPVVYFIDQQSARQ